MRTQSPRPRTYLRLERLEPRDVPHALALTPLVEVSEPSPFLGHPIEANDPAFGYSTEVEPYLAVDPANPNHLVGAWIQDFARGIVAAVSVDGGDTWQSVTLPGTTVATGGVYPHSSDPWVTFSPDGSVYLSLFGHDVPDDGNPVAVFVCKSTDGGLTWGAPTTLVSDVKYGHDKETVTADPYDSRFVYATWTKFANHKGIPMFSRTTDGGQTWEPARQLFDPGGLNTVEGGQIVVLPDGTLVNMFTEELFKNAAGGRYDHKTFRISLIRSTDHGQTWQSVGDRIAVSDMRLPGDTRPEFRTIPNPDGGTPIRAPLYFFDLAVDPRNGNLYAVWPDARFGSGEYTGIAFSMSADGGLTWSTPIQVNQTPDSIPAANQQAFLPSVAVNDEGVVAVTYYDFRNNTPAAGLPTDVWMVHAHPADGLTNPASWTSENRFTPESFDMEAAPNIGEGYFLGDYQGLVAQGSHFGAFFAMPSSTDGSGVFYRDPLSAPPIDSPGGGASPSAADFNHDGRDDVAVIIPGNKNVVGVYLSNGDGTFRQPSTLTGAKGDGLYYANASDVNGDGHPDVVAWGTPKNAKYTGNCGSGGTDQCIPEYEGTVYENVWLGRGDGTFGKVATTSHPHTHTNGWFGWPPLGNIAQSATADFNRDGINDYAEIDRNANLLKVFIRNGDGSTPSLLTYPTDGSPQRVLAGDFNGDGWADLVVMNLSETGEPTLSVFLNDGTW